MGVDVIGRALAAGARSDAARALAKAAAIDLFTNLAVQQVDAAVAAVTTGGYAQAGLGGATYIADALATAALAAAHPRFCKVSANGRYFRLAGDYVQVAQGGATGSGNDQPAIQAAVAYAAVVGIPEVRLLRLHESWQPTFPGGSPNALLGHHVVITGDVALVGAAGGTTITLKGQGGATRTKTDGTAAWYSGWLCYNGAGVTKAVLRDITVNGACTFTNVLVNTEANVYDKGILINDAYAANLARVEIRNCELSYFAGEIFYMGGTYASTTVFVENLKLHHSPQAAWNPGTLASVFAINLEAGDSYQPAETISGKGHAYVGGRFYNGFTSSFITTESFVVNYAYSYPNLTEPYPKWTRFEGTRFEGHSQVYLSSRTAGRMVMVDSGITLTNYGKLTDINLVVEAWCDTSNNGSIVTFNGIATTTTQVPSCPVGTFYETPRNIAVEINAKRTNAAIAAGRKWARGVALNGNLIDRDSCTFKVRGELTRASGVPAELFGSPPAGSQFPLVLWEADNARGFDVAFPTTNFSVATGICYLGINPQANGTFAMTLTNASNYAFAHGQRMRVLNSTGTGSGTSRQISMAASGAGYALQANRVLYMAGDYVDLEWDEDAAVWKEAAYVTRQQLVFTGSATYDAPNVASGAQTTTTVTVTGAALGDKVEAISLGIDAAGLVLTGYVSAANAVTVVLANLSGVAVNLASTTLSVIVARR
ncbi:MAG TPA: hypothetical protein VFP14_00045 [Novosphingobium sp.]|nr:hypothetical protein [Novosphingobium sp.]